jgi:hypothetical protein
MHRLIRLFYITLAASCVSNSLAMDVQDPGKTNEPLKVSFSRAFSVPADGSWDGLFSGDNVLDPIRYANQEPEQTVFKSGQYALSSTTLSAPLRPATRSGTARLLLSGVTGLTSP